MLVFLLFVVVWLGRGTAQNRELLYGLAVVY